MDKKKMDIRKLEVPIISVAFLILVAGMVALRVASGGSITVNTTDILVGLIPVAVWLVAAGKIQEIGFGNFKLVAAIAKASKSSVERQVSKLPVSAISVTQKGRVDRLEQLRKEGKTALLFQLGKGHYTGDAIKRYLDELAGSLQHVVFEEEDRRFFGLMDVNALRDCIGRSSRDLNAFADSLNASEGKQLVSWPTFVGYEHAIDSEQPRALVLERMEALSLSVLPVVDRTNGRFVGVVERSRIVASMILEITNRLEDAT